MSGTRTGEVDRWQEALFEAASAGDDQALAGLLSSVPEGADLDARDAQKSTPLMRALWTGRRHCAELLLSAGAALSLRNCYGRSPREFGADNQDLEYGERTEGMTLVFAYGARLIETPRPIPYVVRMDAFGQDSTPEKRRVFREVAERLIQSAAGYSVLWKSSDAEEGRVWLTPDEFARAFAKAEEREVMGGVVLEAPGEAERLLTWR